VLTLWGALGGSIAGCGAKATSSAKGDEPSSLPPSKAKPAAEVAAAFGDGTLPLGTSTSSEADGSSERSAGFPLADADSLFSGLEPADFSEPLLAAESFLPDTEGGTDLSGFDTPVKSQGNRGWCTAFATVAAIENLASRTLSRRLDLSEIHHWSSYKDPSDIAGGATLFQSANAAESQAIALESVWPYRGQPTVSDVDAEGIAKITTSRSLSTRAAVLEALDRRHPVVIGTRVTPSWQAQERVQITNDGVTSYRWQPKRGTPADDGIVRFLDGDDFTGGHAIAVVGYGLKEDVPGGGYFILKNSWAEGLGDGGYYYLPFSWCQRRDGAGLQNYCYFIEVSAISVAD
jgi:hypothetical protein